MLWKGSRCAVRVYRGWMKVKDARTNTRPGTTWYIFSTTITCIHIFSLVNTTSRFRGNCVSDQAGINCQATARTIPSNRVDAVISCLIHVKDAQQGTFKLWFTLYIAATPASLPPSHSSIATKRASPRVRRVNSLHQRIFTTSLNFNKIITLSETRREEGTPTSGRVQG
nr:hypothetical protein CFP56_21022 [Quercus suber]